MKRRDFLLASLGTAALALSSSAQGKKQYVCPPCGCSHDGQVHDAPGNCPVCGMALIDASSVSEISGIANFWKVNNYVWTGGQPTMEQLAKLKGAGVKVIVNLRPAGESNSFGVREAAYVDELGMAYFNVPVTFGALRPEAVDDFLKLMDSELKNGPVFIHCAAGVRVGGFWMIRRVLRDGWDFDTALQEANKIGLGNQKELIQFAREYIAKHE